MGDGALTKEQLDAEMAEWIAWRKERDAPKPAAKSVPASAARPRNAVLIDSIIKAVAPHVVALEKQVSELQMRVAELERKGYVGIWRDGKEYSPQSEVTHDGARWICHKRTSDKPGKSGDWTMIEKSEPAQARSDATEAAIPRENGHLPANPRLR